MINDEMKDCIETVQEHVEEIKDTVIAHAEIVIKESLDLLLDQLRDDCVDSGELSIIEVEERIVKLKANFSIELEDSVDCIESLESIDNLVENIKDEIENLEEVIKESKTEQEESLDDFLKLATKVYNYNNELALSFINKVSCANSPDDLPTNLIQLKYE